MKCQQNKNLMLLDKSSTYTKRISLKLHFLFKLVNCCLNSDLLSKEQKLAQICAKTQHENRSINFGFYLSIHRWTDEMLAFLSQSLKSVLYPHIWKTEESDILRYLAHTSRTSTVCFTQKVLAFFPGRWKENSFWHWPKHTMEDK